MKLETANQFKTCLLEWRGTFGLISRSRAAYLFRAARSRRHGNVQRLTLHAGGSRRLLKDCAHIITTSLA